jgi:asparagine synthase (glutamine-hydrolysing)
MFYVDIEAGHELEISQSLLPYTLQHGQSEIVFSVGQIKARYNKLRGSLHIDIPISATDILFYRLNAPKLHISNDLRALYKSTDEIDLHGLYALLQFGAVVPPLTIWKNIKQFTPGKEYFINTINLSFAERARDSCWPDRSKADNNLSIGKQKNILSELVDATLIESCPNKDPIILFSGGVDSGVLAARAAAMGWNKATLVNYGFGKNDKESVLAEQMARHLKLEFIRINDDETNSLDLLEKAADTYSLPFFDGSALPTYALSLAVIKEFSDSKTILDGTGADGAFGLFHKASLYQKLDCIPRLFLLMAGYLYELMACWKNPSRIEHVLRVLRRAAQMPRELTGIAQNPLLGILYEIEPQIRLEVIDLIRQWLEAVAPAQNIKVKLAILDLSIICARTLAQKNKSIFDMAGRKIVYPYLDDSVIGVAIKRASYWPGNSQPKRVLKSILASDVPHHMVYRPKSGFVPPLREKFLQQEFISAYEHLIEGNSVVSNILDCRKMEELLKDIKSGTLLPAQTTRFIWGVVFTHCWLNQLETAKHWRSEYHERTVGTRNYRCSDK